MSESKIEVAEEKFDPGVLLAKFLQDEGVEIEVEIDVKSMDALQAKYDELQKSLGQIVPADPPHIDLLEFVIIAPLSDAENETDRHVGLTMRKTLSVPCILLADDAMLIAGAPDIVIRREWLSPKEEADLEIWRRFNSELRARNERLGYKLSKSYILQAEYPADEQVTLVRFGLEVATAQQSLSTPSSRPKTHPLPSIIRFGSNNIHRAAVRAFSMADTWPNSPIDEFFNGVTQSYKHLHLEITVGLPTSLEAETLWSYIKKGGARMVKAHYVLWARWYEGGGNPGEYIPMNLNQFCSDLGFTPHQKGGHRREHKQEALKLLEGLTSVEMRATFTPPRNGKLQRLRGPLWNRGLMKEEKDQLDQAREGNPHLWEPTVFSYAPGAWFTNPDWLKYNRAVGKIGSGLMKLDNNKDEWAILIGAYLGTLMRTNQYAPIRSKIATILKQTGLPKWKDAKDAERRSTEIETTFKRAMDRLVEVGVFQKWEYTDAPATPAELTEWDDPAAIEEYFAVGNLLPNSDWRERCVLITLPADLEADRERLQVATWRRIAAHKRKPDAKGTD